MKHVKISDITVGNDLPLTIIAGPCQLETADHAQMIAGTMKEACDAAGAQYVFKASYDKANRTSLSGKRGMGIDAGLKRSGRYSQDHRRSGSDRRAYRGPMRHRG